jgi:hypothetical protein
MSNGGLGRTHYDWEPPVRRTVQLTLSRFSNLTANTYIDHPWPMWDGLSVDYWGRGGRGDPVPPTVSWSTVRFLMRMHGKPLIRHLIYEHSLWTRSGGWSYWAPADHSGRLRHIHVTYLP